MPRRWTVTFTPLRVLVITGVVLAGAGGAIAVIVTNGHGSATPPPTSTSTSTSVPPGSTSPPPALRVTGMAPVNATTEVAGTSEVRVTFSTAMSPGTPMPTLSPSQPGTWNISAGRTLVFRPTMPFMPLTGVTVVVPGGPGGVRGDDGARLARGVVDRFRIEDGSTTRLQQILSLLDYSPLAFTPRGTPIPPADASAQRTALFSPPDGSFVWRSHGWPFRLVSLWKPGLYNVMTKGLVMEFQADHGLTTSGATSAALWQALLQALAAGNDNTGGYDYALGDKAQPETLTIWHDGVVAVHVYANTGIPQSPTADGNFPVFARYRSQVMRGTNPDGSKYADPVQYVAYFNGGDAVHYIPRANYGIPQSLGCIELDLSDAAKVWPYLAYGTIVSVIN